VNEWLIDAADLLAEPDPGPTPWLVDDLIVDKAIVAAVGRWKTTKSYALLDICISIASGRPAFGKLAIPHPGLVVFVNEESGRDALWRRLDALCRGRAINPEELRDRLLLGANARVKLDEPDWQERLLELGQRVRPRLFVFDPLARMKAPARDENAQKEMAVPIEYLRLLRDETDAATLFVQHTGRQGEHMRGSSDLESVWETKLEWKREGESFEIKSSHREAEPGPAISYRINWDAGTRTIRFDLEVDELEARVIAYRAEHPNASANEVDEHVEGNRQRILTILRTLKESGSETPEPPRNHPPSAPPEGGSPGGPFRAPGTTTQAPGSENTEPLPFNNGADRPFPILGDELYPLLLANAAEAGHITEAEFDKTLALHNRIAQALEANHG
jgi:AAA domain